MLTTGSGNDAEFNIRSEFSVALRYHPELLITKECDGDIGGSLRHAKTAIP